MKCIFNGFGQNSKENSKMKKKGSSPQSWELNKLEILVPKWVFKFKYLSIFFWEKTKISGTLHIFQLLKKKKYFIEIPPDFGGFLL